MDFILSIAINSVEQVWLAFQNNWPFLLVSVLIAAFLRLYMDTSLVSSFLNRYRGAGVLAATAVSVATPLCSCGTTAVLLGMLATTMPWAPVIAFMVSSPLTSPEGLVYSAGIFGWPFALAFFLASILLGLAGGAAGALFDSRGWLKNQTRLAPAASGSCACSVESSSRPVGNRVFSLDVSNLLLATPEGGSCCRPSSSDCGCNLPSLETPAEASAPSSGRSANSCGCGAQADASTSATVTSLPVAPAAPAKPKVSLASLLAEMYTNGKRLLLMFGSFAFIGYFLNGLIPSSWVAAVFGSGNAYSVPLAATLGLPFYINSEASLPLVRALIDSGMSQGAALAFMISGSGTSIGAMAGALAIARWRVIGLVVAVLWIGAILSGVAYDLALSMGLF